MHKRAGEATERAAAERGARWWARLTGVAAGGAGLGIAALAAGLLAPAGSPVPAVGELVISLLPGPLVNFGKENLGHADKPVLLIIITLVVLALAGLAGQLEWRRKFAGGAIFAVLAVLGLIGVGSQAVTSLNINALVPTVVGLVLGYMLLSTLIGKLHRWRARRAATEDHPESSARRNFLGWTVAAGVIAVAGTIGGQLLAGAANAVNTVRDKLKLPTPATPAPPVPAGAELGVPDLSPYVTPNADFYRIDTALQVPVLSPDNWSLTITGMVQNEVHLSYADLVAKPLVEHMTTLTCVSNEIGGDLIGNALWLGYPIRELLKQAVPAASADMVLSTSDDGWTAGTPLSALTDPKREALLAIGMNGEPLPIEHGFPVRMVVPGLYGYVSATKWVRELKVTTFAADQGYWTPLGWSAKGPIKLCSRIDVPRKSTVSGPTVVVAGVAWCQHTGISKVEVQFDGGEWLPAQLADTAGPDTWRQWRYEWAAAPGTHKIAVRATDANGKLQISDQEPPAPDGATGYHTIQVRVR